VTELTLPEVGDVQVTNVAADAVPLPAIRARARKILIILEDMEVGCWLFGWLEGQKNPGIHLSYNCAMLAKPLPFMH
jgi:hypothetical protein